MLGVAMDRGNPLFIAETDERGEVIWVWQHIRALGTTRPIRHPSKHLGEIETAQFSGASRHSIIEWLSNDCASSSTA